MWIGLRGNRSLCGDVTMGNWANWCCVSGPCIIVTDDFERADDTDLGADWDERSGDWSIDTNRLKEAGTSGAMVICTTPNPLGERSYVQIYVYPNGGEKYRIILNYLNDGSYQYVEVECGASDIVLTAGGQTRTYAGASPAWDGTVEYVMSGGITDGHLWVAFAGNIPLQTYCVWDANISLTAGGNKVGIGNGGTVELFVDIFVFWKHGQDQPGCPDPGCWCEYVDGTGQTVRYYIAWKIRLDWYANPWDKCAAIAGSWAELEFNCGDTGPSWDTVDGLHFGVALALGDGTLPVSEPGFGDIPRVFCGSSERCDWYIVQSDPSGFCCETYAGWTGCIALRQCEKDAPTALTCGETWQLRYDAILGDNIGACLICGGPDQAGSYWIIATENV